MARNEEKAHSMLNRWQSLQRELRTANPNDVNNGKRPRIPTEINDISQAQKWRGQLVTEITSKISLIQNPGLGEVKIRELNDEINKLLKQKNQWEYQIKKLGGPTYAKTQFVSDGDGIEVPSSIAGAASRGYKYFGAAKDLPGVRELFLPKPKTAQKRTKKEIEQNIKSSYYGFDDEDHEGILLKEEAEAERKLKKQMLDREKLDLEKKKQLAEIDHLPFQEINIPDISKSLYTSNKESIIENTLSTSPYCHGDIGDMEKIRNVESSVSIIQGLQLEKQKQELLKAIFG